MTDSNKCFEIQTPGNRLNELQLIYKVDVGVFGVIKMPVYSKDEIVLKVGETILLVICSHNKW